MTRPFCWCQYFWPSGLDLDFDLLLEKTWIGCRGGISPVRTDPDLVSQGLIFPINHVLFYNPYIGKYWQGLYSRIYVPSRIYEKIKSSRIKSVLQYLLFSLRTWFQKTQWSSLSAVLVLVHCMVIFSVAEYNSRKTQHLSFSAILVSHNVLILTFILQNTFP